MAVGGLLNGVLPLDTLLPPETAEWDIDVTGRSTTVLLRGLAVASLARPEAACSGFLYVIFSANNLEALGGGAEPGDNAGIRGEAGNEVEFVGCCGTARCSGLVFTVRPALSISTVCDRFSFSSFSDALSFSRPTSFPSSILPVRIAFCKLSDRSFGRTEAPRDTDCSVRPVAHMFCLSALNREIPGLGGFADKVASNGTSYKEHRRE